MHPQCFGNRARGEELKNRISSITINPVAISSGDNKTLDFRSNATVIVVLAVPNHCFPGCQWDSFPFLPGLATIRSTIACTRHVPRRIAIEKCVLRSVLSREGPGQARPSNPPLAPSILLQEIRSKPRRRSRDCEAFR